MGDPASGEPRPTTVQLQRLARAYRESGALLAAVELGVFSKIAGGADTEAALTAALGISDLNAERIIIACLGLGLIERDGARLRNAADVDRFLVDGKHTYAGAWMFFTHPDWGDWGRLAEHLRNPAPATLDNDTVKGITVDEARRYHRGTYSIGRGAGRLFVRQVDLSKRTKILDLGGGSGAYCIEACKAHGHLFAVVLDLPPVAVVAREFIAEHGLSDRIEAIGADFNSDPFPTDADVAIMASNLPMYGRDAIAAVVRRTHDALLPGGEMHLIGEALDDDRSGPSDPAIWGLAQTLHNSTGIAHSLAECTGYFEAAGFRDIVVNDFVPGVLKRITGVKPG
jgi:SAM-dependent methyltransferase